MTRLRTCLFINGCVPRRRLRPWTAPPLPGSLDGSRLFKERLRAGSKVVDEGGIGRVRDEIRHESLGAIDLLVFGVVEQLPPRLVPGRYDIRWQPLRAGEAANLLEHPVEAGLLHRG